MTQQTGAGRQYAEYDSIRGLEEYDEAVVLMPANQCHANWLRPSSAQLRTLPGQVEHHGCRVIFFHQHDLWYYDMRNWCQARAMNMTYDIVT